MSQQERCCHGNATRTTSVAGESYVPSQTSAAVVLLVLFDHAEFITFSRNQCKVSTSVSQLIVFQTLTTNTSSVLNQFRLHQKSLFLCCFRFLSFSSCSMQTMQLFIYMLAGLALASAFAYLLTFAVVVT